MLVTLDQCNRFLDEGFSLLTVGGKKIPNFEWEELQKTPLSKEELNKRYNYKGGEKKADGRWIPETTNVGFITGYNNLEVVDVDCKVLTSLIEQQNFWIEYVNFLKDHISDFEDKFVIYKTINNGFHILYKCEVIAGNSKLAMLEKKEDEKQQKCLIESRGRGGYVFVYNKQISKRGYNDIQEISPEDREMLWGISRTYDFKKEEIIPDKKTKVAYSEGTITPWDDYNQQTRCWDLVDDEFTIVRKLSDKIIIKRHGADSAHSGYIYSDRDLMYIFSTSTQYPNEKALSAAAIYTYKYHSGNWSEAAKELYSKGFGSRYLKEPESITKKIKFNKSDLEFPIEIFPEKLQNYLIQCNKTLDSSIDYMGSSLIWLLSVIIGNSFKVQVKTGWIESVNVWISIVGKAGLGKTPSISNIIQPLVRLSNVEVKRYQKNYEKYRIYDELDKKEKETAEVIKRPIKTQFIVNDITQEALIELHEENKNSVGVFKDELAGWFKDMNKYRAGSDLEFWLSSWSNKGISLNRKTARSSFVESPIIPVLGGIQPTILTQFFTEENKDNGFIDRMLTCFPDLQIDFYNENEMTLEVLTWYNDYMVLFYDKIKKTFVKHNEEGEIDSWICKFDSEAKKEWLRIFNEVTTTQNSEEENEYMKSMLPKQKSYIPRFATLLHILNCYDTGTGEWRTITKDSILKAEKLSKYFINMAKKIKIDSAIKKDIMKIIQVNESKPNKDKYIEIMKNNPDTSVTDAAEFLGVSRQTIHKYKTSSNG